jgi:dCTP deaminase
VAFWTKERLELEQSRRLLVMPYSSDRIEQCAYALGVAAEYAITSAEDGGIKRIAAAGEHITIPPGQFALLLSEEKIAIPPNAIALISMKARFKLRGLINVSGFHVDPGFSGRLKFAVYNAGGTAIDLKPGQELFLIWYCDLDQTTAAVYSGSHQGQDGITAEDVMSIRGIVVSPAGISSRMSALEESMKADLRRLENNIDTHQNWSRPLLTAIAVGVVFFLLNSFVKPCDWPSPCRPTP